MKGNLPGLVPELFSRGSNPIHACPVTAPAWNCSLCLILLNSPPGGSKDLQMGSMAGAPVQL